MKNKYDIIIITSGIIITLLFIIQCEPVSDVGDGPAYLSYAKAITSGDDISSYINRSPIYPLTLAFFIDTFGQDNSIKYIIYSQFLLHFLSAYLLYRLLKDLKEMKIVASVAFFLVLLNLASMYYGYMLLTETFTVFCLMLTIFFLIKGLEKANLKFLFLSGLTGAILVLTRFNTVPLLLIFLLLIFVHNFLNKSITLRGLLMKNLLFILPSILILGGYSIHNKINNNFFGLFNDGGSRFISRNALVAILDGDEIVSEKSEEVLNIFLETKSNAANKPLLKKKGSLVDYVRPEIIGRLYSGFRTYSASITDLCLYKGIDPKNPEPQLTDSLRPFFSEIRKVDRKDIFEVRVLSLLNSLRSSSGIVLANKDDINFNRLPGSLIIVYKLSVVFVSCLVIIASVIYISWKIINHVKIEFTILIMIFLVFGFYLINFGFATVGDANRFKFPAEPLIIGLAVYYFSILIRYLKLRRNTLEH